MQKRADSFLLAILLRALEHNQDFIVEDLLSERLLYGINTLLIPALAMMKSGFSKIRINRQ